MSIAIIIVVLYPFIITVVVTGIITILIAIITKSEPCRNGPKIILSFVVRMKEPCFL